MLREYADFQDIHPANFVEDFAAILDRRPQWTMRGEIGMYVEMAQSRSCREGDGRRHIADPTAALIWIWTLVALDAVEARPKFSDAGNHLALLSRLSRSCAGPAEYIANAIAAAHGRSIGEIRSRMKGIKCLMFSSHSSCGPARLKRSVSSSGPISLGVPVHCGCGYMFLICLSI